MFHIKNREDTHPSIDHRNNKRLTVIGEAATGGELIKSLDPTGRSVIRSFERIAFKNILSTYATYTKAGTSAPNTPKINQDECIAKYIKSNDAFFFSVLDGHGPYGHEVSNFVKTNLINHIEKELVHNKNPCKVLEHGIKTVADQLENSDIDILLSGTTCVSCLIYNKHLYIGNVGDSRIILGRSSNESIGNENQSLSVIALSVDHKPNLPEEKYRIIAAGGRVEPFPDEEEYHIYRVWQKHLNAPGLAMSRSIGDQMAADVGVISDPDINTLPISKDDKFLVIATDGIWEFLSNEQVGNIVLRYHTEMDPQGACQALVEAAERYWKEEDIIDDITCIVIFF